MIKMFYLTPLLITIAALVLVIGFIILIAFLARKKPDKTDDGIIRKVVDNRPAHEIIGEEAETLVADALANLAKKHSWKLVNHVIVKDNGKMIELDHLLFTRSGIHVIETKYWGGKIVGNPDDEYWTQIKDFDEKRCRNPLFQNDKHAEFLSFLLRNKNINCPIYDEVLILKADITEVSDYIFDYNSLIPYLGKLENESSYTTDDILRWYEALKYNLDDSKEARDLYLRYIKDKFEE